MYVLWLDSLNRFGAHKLVLSFSLPLLHIVHISFFYVCENAELNTLVEQFYRTSVPIIHVDIIVIGAAH